MVFHLVTIFPDSIRNYFDSSILKRAQKNKIIKIKFYNPRDFAKDKHRKVDDKPFGGGPGMVLKIEPIIKTIGSILKIKNKKSKCKIIVLAPAGKQFTQKMAREWAKKYKDIVLISGRYEGIDARVKTALRVTGCALQEISVGPYVLTGGELPAAVIVDAVSRQIPGILGKKESLEDERGIGISVYTRPEIFSWRDKKYKVPKVLLSGNHSKIKKWKSARGRSALG